MIPSPQMTKTSLKAGNIKSRQKVKQKAQSKAEAKETETQNSTCRQRSKETGKTKGWSNGKPTNLPIMTKNGMKVKIGANFGQKTQGPQRKVGSRVHLKQKDQLE